MSTADVVVDYVRSCASGAVASADCGPMWQVTTIAVIVLVLSVALIAMQFRPITQATDR